MKHEICDIDEVPDVGSKVLPFFGRDIHVYRRKGKVAAVANACLHLGGPLRCEGENLVCEWHGAKFEMMTGDKVEGPAPRNSRLMFLPTIEEEGKLFYVWRDNDA